MNWVQTFQINQDICWLASTLYFIYCCTNSPLKSMVLVTKRRYCQLWAHRKAWQGTSQSSWCQAVSQEKKCETESHGIRWKVHKAFRIDHVPSRDCPAERGIFCNFLSRQSSDHLYCPMDWMWKCQNSVLHCPAPLIRDLHWAGKVCFSEYWAIFLLWRPAHEPLESR